MRKKANFFTEQEAEDFSREWNVATNRVKIKFAENHNGLEKAHYIASVCATNQANIDKAMESGAYREAKELLREQILNLVKLRDSLPSGGMWKNG